MNIGAAGIIVNQAGKLLVIKRDDTRTWAIPGGSLDVGEAPDTAVVREVEEETGFKVLPVRLVGLYFTRGLVKGGSLQFVFRCLVRGGEARGSAESLEVGYIPTNPIAVPMFGATRERVERGLRHKGGSPDWGSYTLNRKDTLMRNAIFGVVYPYKNLKRKILRQPPHVPPTPWTVGVFVVLRNEDGDVLWVQRTDNQRWNLPGGGVDPDETPWDAAVREAKEETGLDVVLTELTGIYTKTAQHEIVIMFTADVVGGELTVGPESADFVYLPSGSEYPNTLPLHIERVADAISPDRDNTIFKYQVRPAQI